MKLPEILEKEFDVFFSNLGYDRVTNIIGSSPPFKNADYINQQKQTIIELKILDKDFFRDGGIIDRFNATVVVPQNIDASGYGVYKFSLPPENRENRIDTFEEPLRRILKKANRQLKETKNYFFEGQGDGIVLLAINRFVSLHPMIIANLISELLKQEFSSISNFILCTPTTSFFFDDTQRYEPICLTRQHSECTHKVNSVSENLIQNWYEFNHAGGHSNSQQSIE